MVCSCPEVVCDKFGTIASAARACSAQSHTGRCCEFGKAEATSGVFKHSKCGAFKIMRANQANQANPPFAQHHPKYLKSSMNHPKINQESSRTIRQILEDHPTSCNPSFHFCCHRIVAGKPMGFRWQNHRQVTFGADLAENEATKKWFCHMGLSHCM